MDENKAQSGWGSRIVKGFQKSWAWLAAVGGFVLAVGPDLANLAIASMGTITTAFPEMSLKSKVVILLISNVMVILLRPLKQPKWMRPDEGVKVPVAVIQVPSVVAVGANAVVVATEIEQVKVQPGSP